MKKLWFLLFFLPLLILISCNTSKKPFNTQENITLKINEAAKGKEFGLLAENEGKKVYIDLLNKTKDTIPVTRYNFAIIANGKLYKFNTEKDFAQIPSVNLLPDCEVAGYIEFNGVEEFNDLTGQKLVFNDGKHQPIFTIIVKAK